MGSVWVARMPLPKNMPNFRPVPGEIRIDLRDDRGQVRDVGETFDTGWHAEVDGQPAPILPHLNAFLSAKVPRGATRLVFRYDPWEVRVAIVCSLVGIAGIFGLAIMRRMT